MKLVRFTLGIAFEDLFFQKKKTRISFLFSDIVGFTTIASRCKPIDVVEQVEFDFNTYKNTYNASGILLVKTMGNSMSDVLLTVSSINRVANHIVYLPVKRRLEDGEIVNLITPMLLVLNNILASGRSIFKLSFMSSPSERLTRYPLYVEAGVVGKMVCEMCTNAYV